MNENGVFVKRVLEIGGLFVRAPRAIRAGAVVRGAPGRDTDTDGLRHAAVVPGAGPTVFAPFAADPDYFGRAEQKWMVNFRVRGLAAMVAQLTAAGTDVQVDPQEYPNGRFARLHDPEGNPIELWQPIGKFSESVTG